MIKTGMIWSGLAIVLMAAISFYGYVTIPEGEMIARHWGIDGEADGYSPRNAFLFQMPLMAFAITALLAILPVILPKRENLQQSSTFYLVAWLGAMLLLVCVHGVIVHAAATGTEPSQGLIMVVVGGFIAVLGNFMAKSKSNWVAGLRNPWTLTSEHAWTVGNRLGGYLFMATGLATMLIALTLGMSPATFMLLGGTIGATVIASAASYFAWRNDPEAQETKA